jgi:hypothetical protein
MQKLSALLQRILSSMSPLPRHPLLAHSGQLSLRQPPAAAAAAAAAAATAGSAPLLLCAAACVRREGHDHHALVRGEAFRWGQVEPKCGSDAAVCVCVGSSQGRRRLWPVATVAFAL